MLGLMMDMPLTVASILRHAEWQFPKREIVSVTRHEPRHRQSYAATFARARRLANALRRFGLRSGERVASVAWNDFRHLELYYGVSGAGHVLHTVNPRLFDEQIVYMIEHAGDRLVFLDPAFVPLFERLQARLPGVEGYVLLTDAAHLPATALKNACAYETLIGAESDSFDWPALDERQASGLCYTSGTTGNPKGVLYSHRAMVLHALGTALPDVFALSARECVMPIVPLFHANGWGTAHACPMAGTKLVFPGPKLGDPATLHALIEEEGVSAALGVPTVWLGLTQYLAARGERLRSLKRVVIGGAACPPALMETLEREHGVHVHHAWGMTETTPLGTLNAPTAETEALPEGERRAQLRLARGARPLGGERLLPAGGSFTGLRRRRLVRHGRCRDDRCAGLRADHRSHQGCHQVGRGMDLFHRARESGDRASGGRRGGGDRRAASEVGRAANAGRGAQGRCDRHARRIARFPRRPGGELVDSGRGALRRGDPAHGDRQDQQARAAAALCGGPRYPPHLRRLVPGQRILR